ncbi:MAG: ABC transporter permease [Dehalococcoidia bacterium]|nr:ABC transporter permease [Dehalococcoidia bacterium]NUQ54364.1 ABC transporter permease [Dehalococcoidia bacterium]
MSSLPACLAIFERDVRAVVRSRSQLYSSMFTPLLLLVFLGSGVSHGLAPSRLPAGGFTSYMVAGVVVMTSLFSSTFASASYYRDRDSGMLRFMLTSPHSARTILLGKSLAGVVIGTAQALVVMALAAPFLDLGWQYGIVAGAVFIAATATVLNLLLAGFAQVLAARVQTMQGFHLVMNLALFPLLFFSGAFYPIDDLPTWLAALALANPLTYAVDALQVAAYAGDNSAFLGLWVDLPVLMAYTAAAIALASVRLPRLTWSGA